MKWFWIAVGALMDGVEVTPQVWNVKKGGYDAGHTSFDVEQVYLSAKAGLRNSSLVKAFLALLLTAAAAHASGKTTVYEIWKVGNNVHRSCVVDAAGRVLTPESTPIDPDPGATVITIPSDVWTVFGLSDVDTVYNFYHQDD